MARFKGLWSCFNAWCTWMLHQRFFFAIWKEQSDPLFTFSYRAAKPAGICKHAVQFYSDLYKWELVNKEPLVSAYYEGLPKVAKETTPRHCLWKSFTLHVGIEKSPGVDGLPAEFYKASWSFIGDDLLAVLQGSFKRAFLPQSYRKAVITLLPKMGGLQNIAKCCAGSVLCMYYNILSKALTTWVQTIIGHVVQIDQAYRIPNMSTFE